jgi:D-alanyl-D-alanine carboxypeptidase (penicillin-binding protein 5/6)
MTRSARLRASLVLSALVLLTGPLARGQAQAPGPKSGDTGPGVERLQKLLNARLRPSPALDVDGDFGAATAAALQAFQRQRGLPVTGAADAKTLEALGNLTTAEEADAPVPPPEVVNAQAVPRKPADPLDGPPFTTAKAWAIADGATGRLLFGHDADVPRDMASTTKMMTALLVARLAAADPKVLEEPVTFSRRADGTTGSTSGVREGESAPVGELLHGLMLPSGNDAATAFAEHFGPRFAPEDGATEAADPASRFVAEMNRTARTLGLSKTHFANPHGLPAKDHHASAGDLAKLAAAVLADPTLARVVATPQRGATLRGPDGQTRHVVWKNTNRLLDTEGYDGVKTGTTTAAGNCLVASGRRDGRHRIVVILGASASDGRYADARNLFRWAWSQP